MIESRWWREQTVLYTLPLHGSEGGSNGIVSNPFSLCDMKSRKEMPQHESPTTPPKRREKLTPSY